MRMAFPCLAAMLAGCAHTAILDRGADETAIRAVVARLVESWNAGDSAGFSSVFAARHDYVAVDGQLRLDITPAGNAAAHRRVWQFLYPQGSAIRMEIKAIRFPAPDVAIVQVVNHNDFWRDGQRRALTSALTGVLAREDGGWKFVAFNNNAGQGGGAPPAPPR